MQDTEQSGHSTGGLFVKVHRIQLTKVKELLRERVLLPRDAAVLLCLIDAMHPDTGRIRLTAFGLAEELAWQRPHVISTLSRLKKLYMLASVKDKRTGDVFYLLNPYLASIGKGPKFEWLYQQFADALE